MCFFTKGGLISGGFSCTIDHGPIDRVVLVYTHETVQYHCEPIW